MAEDFSAWRYWTPVYLNTSGSGAYIGTAVENFPVLIRLDRRNFSFEEARANGEDIRFSTSAQPPVDLHYEIERWDEAAQAAELWVLVPIIQPNNRTQHIRMYWGNPEATDQSNSGAVFGNLNGFGGVWHMGPAVNDYFVDASDNGYDGLAVKYSANGEGVIGKAEDFDGVGDYIWIDPSPLPGVYGYTISAWIRTDNAFSGNQYLIHSWDWETCRGYTLFFYDAALNAFTDNGPPGCDQGWDDGVLETAQWVHLAVKWSYTPGAPLSFMQVYKNGVEVGEHQLLPHSIQYAGTGTAIGHWNVPGTDKSCFDGMVDEVRVDMLERSPEWIHLCYQNQNPRQTLVELEVARYVPLDGSVAMSGTREHEAVLKVDNSLRNTVVQLGGVTGPPSPAFDYTRTGHLALLNHAGEIKNIELSGDGSGYLLGPVGINTHNTGQYNLAVNGSVGCRLLVVTLDEWADHVLSESYKLTAIEDLEKYIKTNSRLPGMPSAREVTEKGVNVGEMQARLLEKIEELTLYMIQLKNENDQLKARLEKLEE